MGALSKKGANGTGNERLGAMPVEDTGPVLLQRKVGLYVESTAGPDGSSVKQARQTCDSRNRDIGMPITRPRKRYASPTIVPVRTRCGMPVTQLKAIHGIDAPPP